MNKIFLYIFFLSAKYLLLNIFFITILVLFINLLEISRLVESENYNLTTFLLLSVLKIPSIISETIPFVIVIGISFLFRNLISNNELISIRNIGYSILDVYKPIAASIFIFGLFVLLIMNPISAKFEKTFDSLTSKDFSDMYSIKFINNGMWIKNISNNNEKNFININKINLDNMSVKDIKILNISPNKSKIILAKEGFIKDKIFTLNDVSLFNLETDNLTNLLNYKLTLNFDKVNIIDSISNYKFIPFYKYKKYIYNLKKFNLHSSEVSLYYISELLKPFFLVIIGFVVMGFSGKYKRNENFFKILFISILIGFLIFLLKEIVITLTTSIDISYILSYAIIFFLPLIIGLYQIIKIESD